MEFSIEDVGRMIAAIAALGTAAFGIVEGLKWTPIGRAGFGSMLGKLGDLKKALQVAYGADYRSLLEGQYRAGRSKGELPKSLRQGVRIGLTGDNAKEIGEFIGVVDGEKLAAIAAAVQKGETLKPEQRNLLGRFELAVDARIESVLGIAEIRYAGVMRGCAAAISVLIAVAVASFMTASVVMAVLVGILAVPIAPIAKDLTRAISGASMALRGGKSK